MESDSEELEYFEYENCSICWQKESSHHYCYYCDECDHGKCCDCGEQNIENKWCPNCKPLEITLTFSLWTSGNDEIDQLIQERQVLVVGDGLIIPN